MTSSAFSLAEAARHPGASINPGSRINTKTKPTDQYCTPRYTPDCDFTMDNGRQTSFERSSLSSSPVNVVFAHHYTIHPHRSDNCSPDSTYDTQCDESCFGYCDDANCTAQPCSESACSPSSSTSLSSPCAGFVDCDDANPCTRSQCTENGCNDTAPPCFDSSCVEGNDDTIYDTTLTTLVDGLTATPNPYFVPPDDATLQFQTENGTTERDGEYQSEHTDIIDNHTGNGLAQQRNEDLGTTAGEWNGTLFHPANRRQGFANIGCVEYGREIPLGQQIHTPVNADGAPVHCHWGEPGDLCHQSFVDFAALDVHVQSTHIASQPAVQCQWDGCVEPTLPSMVLDHVKDKHDFQGQLVCLWSDCSEIFNEQVQLEEHLQTMHAPDAPIRCLWEECGARAEDQLDLREHLQTDHCFDQQSMAVGIPFDFPEKASEGAQKICAWIQGDAESGGQVACGLIFDDAEALQHHIKIAHTDHLTQRLGYICQWESCPRRGGAKFTQKGKLERHMQVHTKYKPKENECGICKQFFSTKQAIQQHMRRHTGERPYVCAICQRTFTAGSSLSMHKRKHTKEKPLQCPFEGCGKWFNESSNLSKHKKTHNEIPEHSCQQPGCEMRFHRTDQLKRHLRVSHGIGPFGVKLSLRKRKEIKRS